MLGLHSSHPTYLVCSSPTPYVRFTYRRNTKVLSSKSVVTMRLAETDHEICFSQSHDYYTLLLLCSLQSTSFRLLCQKILFPINSVPHLLWLGWSRIRCSTLPDLIHSVTAAVSLELNCWNIFYCIINIASDICCSKTGYKLLNTGYKLH